MPDGLLNGLYIIPILAVLILVHEFGHFFAARAVGAKVEEFGIGIPPRLKAWEHKGVLWSINWIPFGGFVRVLGEDGAANDPGSMNNKTPAQRAFFLAAGSAMNLLLALVLTMAIMGFQGISRSNTYIGSVTPDSPAAAAGWLPGDRIVEVAGAPVTGSAEVGERAREFADRPMSVVIERGDQALETTVTPRSKPPENEGPTGVGVSEIMESSFIVGSVAPDSAAAAAGFQPGDVVTNVGSWPVIDAVAASTGFTDAAGTNLPVTVDRNGSPVTLNIAVPQTVTAATEDPFADAGITADFRPVFDHVSPLEILPRSAGEIWTQLGAMVDGLKQLVTGGLSMGQVAGPIGMGQITSEVVGSSPLPLWVTLSRLAILLSLNLALLNLLPLPALDGGRLLFVLIEVLRGGKRIPPEREGVVHLAGMVLLIGLMFVVAFLDVGRLVTGGSFFR